MTKLNKPLFQQLQDRWPETDNYLERVGQINNDLQVMREIDYYENHIPDWLEELAISEEDLTGQPEAIYLLKRLWEHGIEVRTRMTVDDFRELQREYELDQTEEMLYPEDSLEVNPNYDILDDPYFETAGTKGDAQLLALPELESKLKSWADQALQLNVKNPEPVTLQQAFQVMHLIGFLGQEQAGPEWVADSLRSLLSSDFYKNAANPQ